MSRRYGAACSGRGMKGDIFVSDGYGNAAIHRFAPDGTLLKTWGGPGDAPGKFYIPHSLCVDKFNRVWVGDREANSIHVFDEDGNILGYMNENDPRYGYDGSGTDRIL